MVRNLSKRTVLSVEGLEVRQLLSANPVSLLVSPAPVPATQPTSVATTAQIQIIVPQSVMNATSATAPTSPAPATGGSTAGTGGSGTVLNGGITTTGGALPAGPQQVAAQVQLPPAVQNAMKAAQDAVKSSQTAVSGADDSNSIKSAAAALSTTAAKIRAAARTLQTLTNPDKPNVDATGTAVDTLWGLLQTAHQQFEDLKADAKAARDAANAQGTQDAKDKANAADDALRAAGLDICNACTDVATAAGDVAAAEQRANDPQLARAYQLIHDNAVAMHNEVNSEAAGLLHGNYGN